MSKLERILVFTGLCLVLTFGPLYAAAPVKAMAPMAKAVEATVPMSTVLQNLKMNGYELVSKVELDHEVYKIDAMSPQGKELSLTMDAHSGQIISPKENPLPRISLAEAVKRVESAGYHAISEIEFSSGKYIVKALDAKDKKAKLKIDGKTGEVTKPWF